MFHKRDDRLQRLNAELLAEEEDDYTEEDYEEYEEYDEDELDEAAIAELLGEETETQEEQLFYRNQANGYGSDIRNYANRYGRGNPTVFEDEEDAEADDLEDEEFLYRDDFRRAKKQQKKAKRAEKKAKRKERKGKLGLAILALIELIAIVGILAWWASWVL